MGGKDIWSVGCRGDSFPPPAPFLRECEGHGSLGLSQAPQRIIAKHRRCSAGVGARLGSALGWAGDSAHPCAVSVGPGGQRQGPAAGPGLRLWARALTVPCTGTHIWLAGAQRCPINAWPGPTPRPPASAHAEGCGVNTCCGRDEILLRGRWGPPGPGRMRGVSTDVWGGQRGREPLACPGATDGKLRPGRQLCRRPGQDPTPGLPGPSSVTLPSGLC